MPRRSSAGCLNVLMNGDLVGEWVRYSGNRQEFKYADTWVVNKNRRPISLSMPLTPSNVAYKNDLVEPFFDNLLPDSTNLKIRLKNKIGADSTKAFDLLSKVGMDCVGGIQLMDVDQEPINVKTICSQELSDEEIEAELIGEDFLRLSIAGAQEKTALLRHGGKWCKPIGATPSTHIVKMPMGKVGNAQADLRTSVENEWLCSKLLGAYGMEVARCDIAQFGDQKTLIVERFDRCLSKENDWWIRVAQEDLCQATNTLSEHKYESDGGPGIATINSLLLGSRNARQDIEHFAKAQILFWMLCAPDGHAKNFSIFLEKYGRFRMTPLYDVISAYPIMGKGKNSIAENKIKMAMAMPGRNKHYHWANVQPRHIEAVAAISGRNSAELIDELCDQTDAAIDNTTALIPETFPSEVAERIFSGVKKARDKLSRR